jgi:hypothetical protein
MTFNNNKTPVITPASSGESTDNLDATPVQDNDQTPVITPASSGESTDNLDATSAQDNNKTPVTTPESSGENTDNLDATSAQDNDQTPVITPESSGESTDNLGATSAKVNDATSPQVDDSASPQVDDSSSVQINDPLNNSNGIDEGADEDYSDEDQFDNGSEGLYDADDKEPKRKKRKSKAQRKAEVIHAARLETLEDYTNEEALILGEKDLGATDQVLKFFGGLLENGAVDLSHPSITLEMREYLAAVNMVEQVNRQVLPAISGVNDRRYVVQELSAATRALSQGPRSGQPATNEFQSYYQKFIQEGKYMEDEDRSTFRSLAKQVVNDVKGSSNILGMTLNSLGVRQHTSNMGQVDYVIVDEASKVGLADFMLACASIDFSKVLIVGDPAQLSPGVPMVQGPMGCMRELDMSILRYLQQNHWPMAKLNLNRRGAAGITTVFNSIHYRGDMRDSARASDITAHPKTAKFSAFFKEIFPEHKSTLPIIYIDVRGISEMKDEVTGSYYNLDTASVIVRLIEKGIREKVFTGSDVPQVTHYLAQSKVFAYAFAMLDQEFPGMGFKDIKAYSSDTFQGDSAPVPFIDPVRTESTGFTNNSVRTLVATSRAEDSLVVVANTSALQNPGNRGIPYITQQFNAAKKNKCCVYVIPDNFTPGAPGVHSDLLNHRYVRTRVLGTEDNINVIDQAQECVAHPSDDPIPLDEVTNTPLFEYDGPVGPTQVHDNGEGSSGDASANSGAPTDNWDPNAQTGNNSNQGGGW